MFSCIDYSVHNRQIHNRDLRGLKLYNGAVVIYRGCNGAGSSLSWGNIDRCVCKLMYELLVTHKAWPSGFLAL